MERIPGKIDVPSETWTAYQMKPLVRNWRNITLEMLEELYRAREELNQRGGDRGNQYTGGNVPSGTLPTWTNYLSDIGLARSTVHRWREFFMQSLLSFCHYCLKTK